MASKTGFFEVNGYGTLQLFMTLQNLFACTAKPDTRAVLVGIGNGTRLLVYLPLDEIKAGSIFSVPEPFDDCLPDPSFFASALDPFEDCFIDSSPWNSS